MSLADDIHYITLCVKDLFANNDIVPKGQMRPIERQLRKRVQELEDREHMRRKEQMMLDMYRQRSATK